MNMLLALVTLHPIAVYRTGFRVCAVLILIHYLFCQMILVLMLYFIMLITGITDMFIPMTILFELQI